MNRLKKFVIKSVNTSRNPCKDMEINSKKTIDLTFFKTWGSYGRVDMEVSIDTKIQSLYIEIKKIFLDIFDYIPFEDGCDIMLIVRASDKWPKVLEYNDIVGDLVKKEVLKDGDFIEISPNDQASSLMIRRNSMFRKKKIQRLENRTN